MTDTDRTSKTVTWREVVTEMGKRPNWEAEYKKLAGVYTRTGLEEFIAKYWPGNRLADVSAEKPTEVYTQEALDAAHALTRERLSKLKIEEAPVKTTGCTCSPLPHGADPDCPIPATAFRHWTKDSGVPYPGCHCGTCEEAKSEEKGSQHPGLTCSKCGVDRIKATCPNRFVDCPMHGTTQHENGT